MITRAAKLITPRILTDYALRDNLAFPVFSSTLAGITVLFPPGGMRRNPLLPPRLEGAFLVGIDAGGRVASGETCSTTVTGMRWR